jgi:4'-phosphopantetheinyl transferase
MIRLLVQSLDAHPDLRRGAAPPGLLGLPEMEHLAALKVEKRRREWLLGCWTAKCLLQMTLQEKSGVFLPLDVITIENDPQGAPCVSFNLGPDASGFPMDWLPSPWNLSISHSGEYAFCGVSDACLGVDLERIEKRPAGFAQCYFTREETARVARARPEFQDVLATAIWSGKEAALKAVRLGLSIDTLQVICRIEPLSSIPVAWTPFHIVWDTPGRPLPGLAGWWRVHEGYVLALAVGKSTG